MTGYDADQGNDLRVTARAPARSYARVASNSSGLPRKDGRYAKDANRRIWMYASSHYRRPPLSPAELAHISDFYELLTGDSSTRKQKWLAMMVRVHPDDAPVLLTDLYLARGSVTNLIGDVILHPGLDGRIRVPSIDAPEWPEQLRWRVDALVRQILESGPIPVLSAIPGAESRLGRCQSCAGPLDGGRFRCPWCVTAIEIAREAAALRGAVARPLLGRRDLASAVDDEVELMEGLASRRPALR